MFDQLLTISVVLLPTLFAVAVEVVGRRIKVHPYWRVAALGFGVGISALTGLQVHRSDRAHREEVRQQHEDVDNLRTDLRQSEVELQVRDAYLRAKLESEAQFYAQLAQFAPGIKILAETSAEFARKQYEAKLVSDRELYQFTMKTVEKIRNFSQKYRTIRDREMDRVVTIASNPEISDTERQTQWNEIFERSVEVNHANSIGERCSSPASPRQFKLT